MYFVFDFYLPQGFKRAQVRIWFLVSLIRRLFKRGRKLFKKNAPSGGAAIGCTQAKSRWRIKAHNRGWGLHLFECVREELLLHDFSFWLGAYWRGPLNLCFKVLVYEYRIIKKIVTSATQKHNIDTGMLNLAWLEKSILG